MDGVRIQVKPLYDLHGHVLNSSVRSWRFCVKMLRKNMLISMAISILSTVRSTLQ